jgi:Protein of unknown function DUF262
VRREEASVIGETLGDQIVVDVRDDDSISEKIEHLTGVPATLALQRIREAHGRTKIRTLFNAEWPATPEALGRMTAALAREAGLHDDIRRALGVTQHLVTRRLNEAPGQTLLRNVFRGEWPELEDRERPMPPKPSAVEAASEPPAPGLTEIDEEDTSAEQITKPFDPNLIRVKLWTPTVDLVMKRLQGNEIDLAPDFQRAAGIWKDRAQSQLIESLLIRIPLPAFYFDGSNEDLLIVVDGIQRLTALKRFLLDKDLKLSGLEYLTELEDKYVTQLPRPLVRRLDETMLTVYLIEKGTPEKAKLNIFKRLNTGGEPLTAQEIRHAMNPGVVREYLKQLAVSSAFIGATEGKFSDDRMTARECVLRFCAFILTPASEYPNDGDLDSFLHATMQTINDLDEIHREDLARRLDRSMNAARRILSDQAFRKPKRQGPRSPVNKALFEAWAVGLDGCTDAQLTLLVENRQHLLSKYLNVFENNREFEQALSQGTGDPKKVRLRFAVIAALLEEACR